MWHSHESWLAFSNCCLLLNVKLLFVLAVAVQEKKRRLILQVITWISIADNWDFQSTTHVGPLGYLCVSFPFWETFNRVCSCYFFFRLARQLRLFTITSKLLSGANMPQTTDLCVMELIVLVLLVEHFCKLFLLA